MHRDDDFIKKKTGDWMSWEWLTGKMSLCPKVREGLARSYSSFIVKIIIKMMRRRRRYCCDIIKITTITMIRRKKMVTMIMRQI